jgi:hypothetical protein
VIDAAKSISMNLDDETRAGLLCYLVVGELVSMARTGDWLNTGHLVELARIWMNANGAGCDWQDRVVIARMAADFAPDVLATFNLTSEKSWRPCLPTDGASITGKPRCARFMTGVRAGCVTPDSGPCAPGGRMPIQVEKTPIAGYERWASTRTRSQGKTTMTFGASNHTGLACV